MANIVGWFVNSVHTHDIHGQHHKREMCFHIYVQYLELILFIVLSVDKPYHCNPLHFLQAMQDFFTSAGVRAFARPLLAGGTNLLSVISTVYQVLEIGITN